MGFPPVDNPTAILAGITTATGRVSCTGDSDSVLPAQTPLEPRSHRTHTAPAEHINPLRKPTETAYIWGVTETFKELQPGLEKCIALKLEARFAAYVESLISLRVDPLIVERADESARKAAVNLPRSGFFRSPATESIRREIDTGLPREEARAPPPALQLSNHAVSEIKQATSTGNRGTEDY